MSLPGAFLGSYLAAGLTLLGAAGRLTVGRPFIGRRVPVAPQARDAVRRYVPRRCRKEDSAGVETQTAARDGELEDDLIETEADDSAFTPQQLYARQFLATTLRQAQAGRPLSKVLDLRPWFVLIVCATDYFQASTAASLMSFDLLGKAIALEPWVLGIVLGLVGAALVRQVELWRRECMDGRPELLTESMWELASNTKNDELLEKGVLLGMLPISTIARALGAISTGERSVSIVINECTEFEKALLQILGSTASCALVHGVAQNFFAARLTSLFNWLAMLSMPEDPSATWWWPAVAAGPAFVPLLAVLMTVAFEYSAYLLTCEFFLPLSNFEARSCQEAVSSERRRCEKLFTLMGTPSDEARLRAEAFRELAKQWEEQQTECKRRREITSLFRIFTAAVVYAVSGGSILAPVLANVAVTDGVVGLFTGKSYEKM